MTLIRTLLLLLIGLPLGANFPSVHGLIASAQQQGSVLVICTGTGQKVIRLDDRENPVSDPHSCKKCHECCLNTVMTTLEPGVGPASGCVVTFPVWPPTSRMSELALRGERPFIRGPPLVS